MNLAHQKSRARIIVGHFGCEEKSQGFSPAMECPFAVGRVL